MKKLLILSISALAFAATANAQNGGVAILDIDAVARELGIEDAVKNQLLTMQNGLNGELQKAQANLQAQMKGAEQAAGAAPTDDQKRQLVSTNQQLNGQFNQLKAQAQQTLAQERVNKINAFREQLKPIALAAAKAKGLSVVLMKVTPPVYAYGDEVDITKATTEAALKAGMKAQATVAPAPVPVPAPIAAPVAAPAGEKGKGKGKQK